MAIIEGVNIRYIQSKSILTPQKRGFLTVGERPYTHSLSPAIGCGFGNLYCGKFCYAQKLPNWLYSRREGEAWGEALVIKENAPELLEQQLASARDRRSMRIFMSPVTDPYQPIERKLRLTRRCLQVFARYDDLDLLLIQTRGPAVVDDLDLIAAIPYAWLGMTLETDRHDLPYGPAKAHVGRRLDAVRSTVTCLARPGQMLPTPCITTSICLKRPVWKRQKRWTKAGPGPSLSRMSTRCGAHQAEQGNEVWGLMGFNNPLRGAFFTWTIIRSASSPGEPLWESIAPDFSTFAGYIDTPEAMEAYAFYQGLHTDGFIPTDNIPDAFPNGLTATFFAIPPTGTVLARTFPDLNWDVMPMPYLKTPLTHTGSFAPGVAAKSDNPEEAKAFVKFFTSSEGYATYHNVTKVVPGRKSLQAQLPDFQEGFLALLFDEMVEWGVSRPGGPAHTIFNRIIASDMMVNIALGGDIEEEVANAILEADAQLIQFR